MQNQSSICSENSLFLVLLTVQQIKSLEGLQTKISQAFDNFQVLFSLNFKDIGINSDFAYFIDLPNAKQTIIYKLMKSAQKKHNALNLPTLQSKRFSYIQNSLKVLDEGSLKGQKLHIDGGIGDYRMRLFRLKDKNQYRRANHSVFTASFTNKLIKAKQDNDYNELKSTIEKIISRPPHRESGIVSSLSQRDQQMQRIKKGSFVNTIEEGQHLIYPYISEYQRKRWFDTVNNSKEKPFLEKFEKSEVVRVSRKVSLKRNKNKYVFAYMDLHQNKQKQSIKN